jgi:MSHA pilin protein MshA
MTGLDMVITRAPGFTLIELVVVIAVVAILAAIAVPRFLDFAADARVAKLNGALGSMRSASEVASMRLQLNGGPTAGAAVVTLGGAAVTMFNGYPDASATGIPVAAGIAGPDYIVSKGVLPPPLIDIVVPGGPDQSNCRVRYQRPASVGASPTFTVQTSGC